jgi:DnaJ-class molecular chaperone
MKKKMFLVICLLSMGIYVFACNITNVVMSSEVTCPSCVGHGSIAQSATCGQCNGVGSRPSTVSHNCNSCSGMGSVSTRCSATGCENGLVSRSVGCRRPTWTEREFAGNCTVCQGSGRVPGRDPRTNYAPVSCTASGCEGGRLFANVIYVCDVCNGSGTHSTGTYNCNTCHGSGQSSRSCSPCGGRGTVAQTKTIPCSNCLNGVRYWTVPCGKCGSRGTIPE